MITLSVESSSNPRRFPPCHSRRYKRQEPYGKISADGDSSFWSLCKQRSLPQHTSRRLVRGCETTHAQKPRERESERKKERETYTEKLFGCSISFLSNETKLTHRVISNTEARKPQSTSCYTEWTKSSRIDNISDHFSTFNCCLNLFCSLKKKRILSFVLINSGFLFHFLKFVFVFSCFCLFLFKYLMCLYASSFRTLAVILFLQIFRTKWVSESMWKLVGIRGAKPFLFFYFFKGFENGNISGAEQEYSLSKAKVKPNQARSPILINGWVTVPH